MSVLTDIIADVYSLTNRPDWVAETWLAIRAATLKAHQRDFYAKDLLETGIQFPTTDYQQSFEPKTLINTYRAMKYIRKYDTVGATPGTILKERVPESILDDYGTQVTDIWYAAGTEIQLKMSTQEQFMLLGVYVHPNIVQNTYKSWIAEEFPFAIVFEATATIFKLLGMDSQVNRYTGLAAEVYAAIDTSNIVTTGS